MYNNFKSMQDSQHLYLDSLISLLVDDIESLRTLKKTIKKSYTNLIREMISTKIEILEILNLKTFLAKDDDEFKLDILNKPKFNLIEYLLDIEINQLQIFNETLLMLNYTNEKRHIIAMLFNRNITLLKRFRYDS